MKLAPMMEDFLIALHRPADRDEKLEKTFDLLLHSAESIDTVSEPSLRSCTSTGVIRLVNSIFKYRDGKLDSRDAQSVLQYQVPILCDKITEVATVNAEELKRAAEVFGKFRAPELRHHPLHHHEIILYDIVEELDTVVEDILFTCHVCINGNLKGWQGLHQGPFPQEVVEGAQYLRDEMLPRLRRVTKSIRDTVIVNKNGFYTKTHAVSVAMSYKKGTSERRKAIDAMVAKREVPNIKAIREAIRSTEAGKFLTEEAWNTKGGRKLNHSQVVTVHPESGETLGDFTRKICKEGRMLMALLPVYCQRSVHRPYDLPQPIITTHFFAPPTPLDIFEMTKYDIDRAYFSPKQFPTPYNLNNADDCEAYTQLCAYILKTSLESGSPFVSQGSSHSGCKRFVCKYAKRTGCKCKFTLKWDKYGYYINLYSYAKKMKVGCFVHNHDKFDESPFFQYKCYGCSKKISIYEKMRSPCCAVCYP